VSALEKLKEILASQVTGHQRLLDLMHREQREVARGKPEELVATLEEIRETVSEIESLETRRESVCREVGREFELESDNPTLDELATSIPECRTTEWENLQDRFRQMVAELGRVNQETSYLIRGSLTWASEILTLLSGETTGSLTYDGSGVGGGTGSGPVLLNKTV
jgi:flagellar biosynthesis/type III secretory pathway chaperone